MSDVGNEPPDLPAGKPLREGDLLWRPRPEFAASSNIARYLDWLRRDRNLDFADYDALWRWSASDLEAFWSSIWDHFEVRSSTPYRQILNAGSMQGARWFEGASLNYAEHLLRYEARAGATEMALLHASETAPLKHMTWHELGRQVRIVATQLRALGILPGDRVVSYMPNIPETVVAMIASIAIGAVWSAAAPEFGSRTVIDRFAQIEPKLLFAAEGYQFGGRQFERAQEVRSIVAALPSLQDVVWLSNLSATSAPEPGWLSWQALLARADVPRSDFAYTQVDSQHPLWVVHSSGTTGLPKAIVHGHAGMLLEHLKLVHLHMNLRPGARLFFYTTTGWMMWNIVVAALHAGATAVLYDGNPAYPTLNLLWDLAARGAVTHFGASPTFIALMQKAGIRPAESHDVSQLEMITVSGSPCTPESFAWIYDNVKSDVWVASQSGGTEICSAFVGAVPTLPVYAGEIQARMLGMDVHAWNASGEEVIDEVGELVVTHAFPSMPLYFWNDKGGRRYHESYFDHFAGVWRHGDFVKINRRGGTYVYGRSDSTLNRHGVRIGTAEIYRVVERVDGVLDSLIVCCDRPDGSFFMPLFVTLRPGVVFDDPLRERIREQLRREGSPRHLPDRIERVEAIPYTLTGKKMEIPVRRILMGAPVAEVANPDAMANPGALDFFASYRSEAT